MSRTKAQPMNQPQPGSSGNILKASASRVVGPTAYTMMDATAAVPTHARIDAYWHARFSSCIHDINAELLASCRYIGMCELNPNSSASASPCANLIRKHAWPGVGQKKQCNASKFCRISGPWQTGNRSCLLVARPPSKSRKSAQGGYFLSPVARNAICS